jgi:hypothetical protein
MKNLNFALIVSAGYLFVGLVSLLFYDTNLLMGFPSMVFLGIAATQDPRPPYHAPNYYSPDSTFFSVIEILSVILNALIIYYLLFPFITKWFNKRREKSIR